MHGVAERTPVDLATAPHCEGRADAHDLSHAQRLVNTFQWRNRPAIEEFFTTDLGARSYGKEKPIYVLTSARTFSGGEELA